MGIQQLPILNAFLNFTALCLLIAGFAAIKNKRMKLHAAFMIAAFFTSIVFLTSYLIYHFHFPINRFQGPNLARTIYLSILIPHIILAVTVPPFAITSLYTAFRKYFRAHKMIAKLTLPIWIFVSVSGITVYFMLYVWF